MVSHVPLSLSYYLTRTSYAQMLTRLLLRDHGFTPCHPLKGGLQVIEVLGCTEADIKPFP